MTTEEQKVQEQAPEQPKKKSVKLLSFYIADIKCIDKLIAEVDGNHFIIVAKNGGGKTSVAQSINRNATRLTPADIASLPIRIGAKNAQVGTTFLIDEDGKERKIFIETLYRPSGSVVKVVDLANNGQLTPPVETIKKLLGESHDVSVLMDMEPDEQFKEMLKMLGGNVSSEQYETEYDELYNSRKNIKKRISEDETDLRKIEPSVGVMQEFRTQGMYAEKKTERPVPPDQSNLIREETEAKAHNDKVERAKDRKKEIELNVEHLKKQLAAEEDKLKVADQWLKDNPEKDMALFPQKHLAFGEEQKEHEKKMKEFDRYNEVVDQIAAYKRLQGVIESNKKNLFDVQAKMNELTEKMKKAVAEVKLEELVPELTIKNELDESGYKPIWRKGIYYKDWTGELLPFNSRQCSYGRMIVALCKLSGFINYGKFNLFSIKAWNELDKQSQKEVLDFVEANDDLNVQLMIEEVDEKPLGIKIIEKKEK